MAASYIEVDHVSGREHDWGMKAWHLWMSASLLLAALVAFSTAQAPTGDQLSSQQTRQTPYEKWLDEDVSWIMTGIERAEYLKLKTDRQRDLFIEAFWERRNPEPGSKENRFKEQHYRRLAYANTHFAATVPGWKTDRGHIYIVYGPPEEIDSAPDGSRPSQVWRYRLEGESIAFRFVDSCACGDYKLVQGPYLAPRVLEY
jgi:GWxTD domain-containing protein